MSATSTARVGARFGVLALALGVAGGAAPAATTPAATSDTLTVVTLNLWHDQRDWPKRMERIVRELRPLRPDVLCLQEVLQHENLRNQAEALAESLGCQFEFASVDPVGGAKRYGNAVLTPHRVIARGSTSLDPANDYRVVAHVRFEWRGREVDAYSTHLHHTPEGGEIRAKQIRHLLAWVDSTRGEGPLVLAGDFNAELGTPEMKLVTARYENAFRALHPKATREQSVTFNKRFGPDPGMIDHIFTGDGTRSGVRPRGWKPIASEVLFRAVGPDSVWASDHYGVLARVRAGK